MIQRALTNWLSLGRGLNQEVGNEVDDYQGELESNDSGGGLEG
jgi:hypothetical protein